MVIQIRFLGINQASNKVEVVPMDFNYATKARDFECDVDRALNKDMEYGNCGVDVMGRSHDSNSPCPNEAFDQYTNDTYCKVQEVRRLVQQKEDNEWMLSMLESCWQKGIDAEGADFLKAAKFVVSYE